MPDDPSVSCKGKAKAKVGGSSLSVFAASVPPDWSLPDLPSGSMSSLVYEAHDFSRDKGKRKVTNTSLSEVFHTDTTSQKFLPTSSVGYGPKLLGFSMGAIRDISEDYPTNPGLTLRGHFVPNHTHVPVASSFSVLSYQQPSNAKAVSQVLALPAVTSATFFGGPNTKQCDIILYFSKNAGFSVYLY